MVEQSQTMTAATKQDRTLTIKCTPTLQWHSANHPPYSITGSMVYEQTGSVPNMPNAVDRQSGDIDLHNMPNNSKYTDNIDITLVLDPSQIVDPEGKSIPARWATQGEGTEPGMGAAWFINLPPPVNYTPITVADMTIVRNSDTQVTIDDNTPGTPQRYAFCLGLVLPQQDNYFMAFEPIISGKGLGRPPV